MAGRGREEMDPSACHINILLASDLIIIKQPIYTVRHVMLVNCTKKKKKNPTACNIKPSNLMPTPLGESDPLFFLSTVSLLLSWICLCHESDGPLFILFPLPLPNLCFFLFFFCFVFPIGEGEHQATVHGSQSNMEAAGLLLLKLDARAHTQTHMVIVTFPAQMLTSPLIILPA